MKRYHTLLSLLVLIAAILGCSPAPKEEGKIILTSFYPMYISTLNIVGDIPGIEVVNMARQTTGCLHDYQLTPDDMVKLEKASIFIVNGAGMESFIERALRDKPDLVLVEASKDIPLLKSVPVHKDDHSSCTNPDHGHSHDHHDHSDSPQTIHEEPNPHVWVAISNAITQVRTISEGLATFDTVNAHHYKANAQAYITRLETLKAHMHEKLQSISSRKIITFHEAFPYFAQEFDLEIAAVVQREPGSEPSSAELIETIKTIRQHNIKAIFAETHYPAKAAQTISRETGVELYTLDPAVTGPMHKDAYLDAMSENLGTLLKALH